MMLAVLLALLQADASAPVTAVNSPPRVCSGLQMLEYRDYDHMYVDAHRTCDSAGGGALPPEPNGGTMRCFNGLREQYRATDHRWVPLLDSCSAASDAAAQAAAAAPDAFYRPPAPQGTPPTSR